MNKLTRGLMSGASLAALSLGSISVAEAGNISIVASTGAVSVTAGQVFSFIEVTSTGTVNGDITNDGVVGVGSAFGISIDNGGSVLATTAAAGDIVNNNIIIATQTGIFVGSTAVVSGDIINNGSLIVSHNGIAGTDIVGILDNGGLAGSVINNSEILVAGTGVSGSFIGVEQNGTHADFTNNGLLKVTGGGGGANYVGVSQHASGTAGVEASITNSATGSIKVDVATVSGFVSIQTGMIQDANATAGAASATLDNSGLIEISSIATGPLTPVGVAQATAFIESGIHQRASGVNSGTSSVVDGAVSLTNESTGTINIIAAANVFGLTSARAFASVETGISQFAHVTQNGAVSSQEGEVSASLTNDGVITVAARAHATAPLFAFASADVSETGIFQRADNGDVSTATLTNSLGATLNVDATAVAHAGAGRASALATVTRGIDQEATAGGDQDSASVTLTNDGTLNIHAVASAFGATEATAFASVNTGISQGAFDSFSSSVSLTNTGTLDIAAKAVASGAGFASADASVDTGISQFASGSDLPGSVAGVTLNNSGTLNIHAIASAHGGTDAIAFASVDTGITQSADEAVTTNVTLTNSGTLDILAQATADGPVFASADASVDTGITQDAFGSGLAASTANVTLTNSGTLNIHALASASGGTEGLAYAFIDTGITQDAFNAVTENITLTNSGTIDILAKAVAHATEFASASATVDTGIEQFADGSGIAASAANITLTNSGTINVHAIASANGGTEALAFASVSTGISQEAFHAVNNNVTLTNSGTIDVLAKAIANASTGFARATATVSSGIFQSADASGLAASTATVTLTNSGTINVHAIASASGGTDASAFASVNTAVSQLAFDSVTESITLTNSGTIDVLARAHAVAVDFARASATVDSALYQTADGSGLAASTANITLNNSGTINIAAKATATGGSEAEAFAFVSSAVFQEARGATANSITFTNSGTFNVSASAVANAVTDAFASAFAFGVDQDANGGAVETFTNSGTFKVTAFASANATATTATESAFAQATGLFVSADPGTVNILNTSSGVFTVSAHAVGTFGDATAIGIIAQDSTPADILTGTIENDGHLNVTAKAPDFASAVGILVEADEFTGTITNKGTLHVVAIGSTPVAVGIGFTGFSTPTGLGVGTVVNDGGTLFVGVSTDGGVTFTRGDAIDTTTASNTININLKGTAHDGNIYGDINVAAGDTITVSSGKTKFDGVINDTGALVGTLAISADGTLEFANGVGLHNASESPAHAFVDTFTQAGTLELEVTPTPGPVLPTATVGTAGFISATSATLGGNLVLALDPGLYGNVTVYQTIFSVNPIAGDWATLSTASNSVLFTVTENRPTAFEADVVLTRVAFNAVAGLTPNEKAVGTGLENAFSTTLTAPNSLLFESLFFLNAAQYPRALDMLSGEEAGEVSQLDVDSADILTKATMEHLDLANAGGATMTASNVKPQKVNVAMDGAPITIWGGGYGQWTNTKDTISGPGYRASNAGVIAGIDTGFGGNGTVGLAFNYTINGSARFNPFGKPVGNHGNYDGFQVGGYARWNADDNMYLQGLISYGNYNNRTTRFIFLPAPLGNGVVTGKFDSDVFAVYGEGGINLTPGQEFNVIPFVAFGYTHASSGAYTEHGLAGANLLVRDATATSTSSFLGVKFNMTDMMGDGALTPTLKLAWRHNFDDNIWDVNAAFDGLASSAFTVTGRDLSKDSLVIGAGLGYAINGDVTAMLDYEGDLSSDRVTQSVMGRIKIRLGEEAPPPPPPPPPAPPPPPPPPPPPVKTFIVFFDFDKSNLTDKAQEVVEEAVRTAKSNGFVKVLVTGHTDTVGSDRYNQALSIRRAQSVKDEMVREGLDAGGISIEGKSFHDPLVPTGPGVREPQNRRAVIDLGG